MPKEKENNSSLFFILCCTTLDFLRYLCKTRAWRYFAAPSK